MTLSTGDNDKTSPNTNLHGGVPTGNTSSTALDIVAGGTSSGALNIVNKPVSMSHQSDFSSELKVHISKSPEPEGEQEGFLPDIS